MQSKADELARYMNANDELKGQMMEVQKEMAGAKVGFRVKGGVNWDGIEWDGMVLMFSFEVGVQISSEAEMGALREEYQQRLSGAERKVSAVL